MLSRSSHKSLIFVPHARFLHPALRFWHPALRFWHPALRFWPSEQCDYYLNSAKDYEMLKVATLSLLIGRYTTIDCMLMMMGIRAMLNRGRNKSLANYTKLSEKQSVKTIG